MSRLKTDAIRNVNASVDGITLDTSGNVAIPNELQLAEKIVHTGDTNTFIRFTDNQIDFQANGSSRLYINQYAAYVQTGYPLAFLSSSGATPNIKSGGTNNQDLLFTTGTNNPTRIHIKADGNVGIGVSPSAPLDVNGWIQSTIGLKVAGHPLVTYAGFTDISGGSYAARLGSTGSSTLRSTQIYGGGGHIATFDGVNTRLGIGKTAPSETLEIFKASGTNLVKISTQANSTIGLLLEKTGSTTQSWKIADGQTANGTLEIYDATESETRLAIDGSGRVIIGQHSHSGGGTLVVVGNSNTPNAYGCAAFCKIGANPTSGQTLAQLRFSAGSGGVNRAAEISVQADSNWNDGTSQESKMIFKVASSGGGNTAGNALMTLKGTGDVEINRGNLVIANDKGISFIEADDTATGESVAGSVLNDYEYGTFTPNYGFDSAPTISYHTRKGGYVKIGPRVYFQVYIRLNSCSGGSGNLWITGLPYAAGNATSTDNSAYGGLTIAYTNAWSGNTVDRGLVGSNNTICYLYCGTSNGTNVNASPSNLNGTQLRASGSYLVSF